MVKNLVLFVGVVFGIKLSLFSCCVHSELIFNKNASAIKFRDKQKIRFLMF